MKGGPALGGRDSHAVPARHPGPSLAASATFDRDDTRGIQKPGATSMEFRSEHPHPRSQGHPESHKGIGCKGGGEQLCPACDSRLSSSAGSGPFRIQPIRALAPRSAHRRKHRDRRHPDTRTQDRKDFAIWPKPRDGMTRAALPRVFVDGNNVMGSRPDGWWRDRADAARRVVADVIPLAIRHSGAWTIVFDGTEPPAMPLPPECLAVIHTGHRRRDGAGDRHSNADCPPSGFSSHSTGWQGSMRGNPVKTVTIQLLRGCPSRQMGCVGT